MSHGIKVYILIAHGVKAGLKAFLFKNMRIQWVHFLEDVEQYLIAEDAATR